MTTKIDFKQYLEKKQFLNLDGLRAISIILVVWHHSVSVESLLSVGFLGVDLFFVISGFLIVTLLLRERRRAGDISLKSFYIRRSLRIFPLSYGVLFLIYGYVIFTDSPSENYIKGDFWKVFFYVSNWFPVHSILSITWSLSAEEQFYLIWPYFEKIASEMILIILGCLLFIFVGIQMMHAHLGLFTDFPSFLLETSFTPILLGVCLAHILDSEKSFAFVHKFLNGNWTSMGCYFFIFFLIGLQMGDISGLPRFAFHLCFTILVGTSVVNEHNRVGSFLQWTLLARIGVVSYGIYLLHLIAMGVVKKGLVFFHIHSEFLLFPLTLILSWIMAELSYRYYETPFLRLKNKWNPVGTVRN